MVYKVPKSKASIKQNRFEFDIAGKVYDIPLMQYVSGGLVEQVAELEAKGGIAAISASYVFFGPVGTPIGDAVRTLDSEQMEALSKAYMEASNVSVGESEASTDS